MISITYGFLFSLFLVDKPEPPIEDVREFKFPV